MRTRGSPALRMVTACVPSLSSVCREPRQSYRLSSVASHQGMAAAPAYFNESVGGRTLRALRGLTAARACVCNACMTGDGGLATSS